MSGHRPERVGQQIHQLMSIMLEREAQDPRLENIRVTRVQVSGDLRVAKVFVVARESQEESAAMMEALARAAGYFRHQLASSMDLRIAPEVRFQLDHSIQMGEHFLQVLEEVQRMEGSQRIRTNKRIKKSK